MLSVDWILIPTLKYNYPQNYNIIKGKNNKKREETNGKSVNSVDIF